MGSSHAKTSLTRFSSRLFSCGALGAPALRQAHAENKFASLVNLMHPSEPSYGADIEQACAELGVQYIKAPIRGSDWMKANVDKCLAAMTQAKTPICVMCASNTRAAALAAIYAQTHGAVVEADAASKPALNSAQEGLVSRYFAG